MTRKSDIFAHLAKQPEFFFLTYLGLTLISCSAVMTAFAWLGTVVYNARSSHTKPGLRAG